MTAFKIDKFGGMTPAIDDRLILPQAASLSENAWLYTGRVQGIPEQTLVRACTAGTAKVFRIPVAAVDTDHIANSTWMEFTNADTDVLRSMVIGDTYERYYWATSDAAPRYNTKTRIVAGSASFFLGVPQPAAVSIAVVGGVAPNITRAYVTTWVSAYGEEGPVSTPTLATNRPDGSWNLTLSAAAANDINATDRNLTKTNIYRTVTSSSGVATYFFVAQITIGTLAYSDTITDATVSLNALITSTNWTAPPTDLQGWVAMPNGIIAAWRLNEIWFCEPYRPHAWPAAYSMVVNYPIVGLGVTNQTLVVCTQAYPVTISGIHPSSMAQSNSASLEPCTSRGSILSTVEGVYYASPNGLVFAGAGSISNITKNYVTKDKWHSLVSYSTLRAVRLGTAYYAFGGSQLGSFDPLSMDPLSFAQVDFLGAYQGVIIDPSDQRIAFNLMSSRTPIVSVFNDPWTGEVFSIIGSNLYRLDLAQATPTRSFYLWRSKIFQTPKPENFGAMKIYWMTPGPTPTAAIAKPGNVTSMAFPALPNGSTYGVVRVYGDGTLVYTSDLLVSGELHRLPSGFRAVEWQIELETYLDITNIQIGSSVRQLQKV